VKISRGDPSHQKEFALRSYDFFMNTDSEKIKISNLVLFFPSSFLSILHFSFLILFPFLFLQRSALPLHCPDSRVVPSMSKSLWTSLKVMMILMTYTVINYEFKGFWSKCVWHKTTQLINLKWRDSFYGTTTDKLSFTHRTVRN